MCLVVKVLMVRFYVELEIFDKIYLGYMYSARYNIFLPPPSDVIGVIEPKASMLWNPLICCVNIANEGREQIKF